VRPPQPELKPAPLPVFNPAAPAITVSPLAAAASPILQLLPGLRGMERAPDLQALRSRVEQDLRTFERQAREIGIPRDLVRAAHYALCASIDDVVLNTPWGAGSQWASRTLVGILHPGAHGTDHFFDQLRERLKAPERSLPVLELMFLCLSLGFMGRYRQGRGPVELDQLRAQVHAAIARQCPPPAQELSEHWRGVAAPFVPSRRAVPVWVAFASALAVCTGLLLSTSFSLNAASDVLLAKALATAPSRMPAVTRTAVAEPLPPAPAAPAPTVLDRLRDRLQPEIDQRGVSVLGTPTSVTIRIPGRAIFAQGSAEVPRSAVPLLDRVAAALRGEPGAVRVIDYSDNQPVHTVQFPSGFQLSEARAWAVRAVIIRNLPDPARVTAEGRAAADPVAPNSTAEGRERNRRIEIVLQRQE
jgi:type VI secretion system protein ImpK